MVNIVTRPGTGIPCFTGAAQLGSYGLSNFRGRFGGSFDAPGLDQLYLLESIF
ncbi:hypothetical protein PGN35_010530 [Nodosilinea sp. PGN35]|uniref:hypothetical protein n=1 Tax=Nodosilinea sp. PGN35 TaxID=3020489 RepID=UPI0023B2C1B1|nr:hypothetical protein [Nodosilinea sp. TSF1-S3]